MKTAEGQNAVIGLAFDPDERPSAPDVPVDIVVSVLVLALDRHHARLPPKDPSADRAALKPRDLAKIGYLYLRHLRDRQVGHRASREAAASLDAAIRDFDRKEVSATHGAPEKR